MKLKVSTVALFFSFGLCVGSHATIALSHQYHLGETGSVSGPNNLPQDSVGGQHFGNLNGSPTVSIINTGLAAPGSTDALEISNNAGLGGTYYNTSFGLTDDWALEIWMRPDATGGTFLGATDGNQAAGTGLRFWATNTGFSGTTLGGNNLSSGNNYLLMSNGIGQLGNTTSTYTAGTWVRVNLIRHDGTVYYYLDGNLQDSASTAGEVNDIRLGAGYWAAAGSNGAFDEMKIWTFDSATDSLASVEAATVAIPEPSTTALLGLGGLALILRRRK